MKTCPFCAESIQDAAIKCRHCGSMLTEPLADRTANTFEGVRKGLVSGIGTEAAKVFREQTGWGLKESNDGKQTLSWKGLAVDASSFVHKGLRRDFSQIESLTFVRRTTRVSVNLVPAGSDHEAYLSIKLLGESKGIDVAYSGSIIKWPWPWAVDKADRVEAIYRRLAKATFELRLQRYLDQLDAAGHFSYDGKVFRRNGTVEDGHCSINLLNCSLQREPFVVTLHSGGSRIRIVAATDGDCFFAILQIIFAIEWREFNGLIAGLTAGKWAGALEAMKRKK